METASPAEQLPEYVCHKRVRAIKIANIASKPMPLFSGTVCRSMDGCGRCEKCRWLDANGPLGRVIVPVDKRFAPIEVSAKYLFRHNPRAGGYYVKYEDGYESFSPEGAFEAGYELASAAPDLVRLLKFVWCDECEERVTWRYNQDQIVCCRHHVIATFADKVKD